MNNFQGLIFNIQRFSVHDGPGIRTTVFMKGCPLNCHWCANPESKNTHIEIMTNDTKCTLCGVCASVCPENAIAIKTKRYINRKTCTLCLNCINNCPNSAITKVGQYLSVEEVVSEILKDELFYSNSGGGMTVSGGEPLLQWQFVYHLLNQCQQKGIHTALDTCGYSSSEALINVLECTDLVLFDIKHIDPEQHKSGTDKSNKKIIANLHLAANKRRTWIRVPVIPGYNDSVENIESLAKLAKETKVEKVSLLPYHMLGINKYAQLGRQYSLHIKPPSETFMLGIKNIIERFGVKVTIGL